MQMVDINKPRYILQLPKPLRKNPLFITYFQKYGVQATFYHKIRFSMDNVLRVGEFSLK